MLTLADLAPGRCVVALAGDASGVVELAASCADEARIELATLGGDPGAAARWLRMDRGGRGAETIAKAAHDAGVVGRLGVALPVAIHADAEIARASLDGPLLASAGLGDLTEGVVVGDPSVLVDTIADYVEAGVTPGGAPERRPVRTPRGARGIAGRVACRDPPGAPGVPGRVVTVADLAARDLFWQIRHDPRRADVELGRRAEVFPYFVPIGSALGREATVAGRRCLMFGSNNYLGLADDPPRHSAPRTRFGATGPDAPDRA